MAKKILIVDDEPNIVTALEYLLQRSGYEVLLAQDGAAALKQVEQHLPDLVLLDVMMAVKSGYEVCQRMRERAEWRHIKIIMLSAKGREVEVNKGLSLGADLYVAKPFSNKDLVATMNPGVHTPHCKAACLRNSSWIGCSPSRGAMPSTVVMDLPSASTASTRHELTSTPSMITLHAPQLPLLHASFVPVRPSASRKTSSKLCRGSHRNSTGSPLMVVWTGTFIANSLTLPIMRIHTDIARD